MILYLHTFTSALGELQLATDAAGRLCALDFPEFKARFRRLLREHFGECQYSNSPLPEGIAAALSRYFKGDLSALDSIPLAAVGGELARKVSSAIKAIPAGKTISYGELAISLGYTDPRMAIEVGATLGSNPIALIVPCHRVIAKDGGLKGYAGGLQRKRWLLEHERALEREPAQASIF